jgi:predicted membrane protein
MRKFEAFILVILFIAMVVQAGFTMLWSRILVGSVLGFLFGHLLYTYFHRK